MNVDYATRESVTVRQPSTANLMIDSADRNESVYPSPADFQITKKQSIMNGFFTRIATTEVTLEWCEPNIIFGQNDEIVFDVSGATSRFDVTVNLVAQGSGANMTVADVLNSCVFELNFQSQSENLEFSVGFDELTGRRCIDLSGNGKFRVEDGTLQEQLDAINPGGGLVLSKVVDIGCPDLRLYRYLDFVSFPLTYNQALKDNSTSAIEKDVLCRWYMAEDTQEQLDQYGFPILMGYIRFVRRRIFSPPKQIRWDPQQPIGNLSFQVFTDQSVLFPVVDTAHTNWLMTLQISEV